MDKHTDGRTGKVAALVFPLQYRTLAAILLKPFARLSLRLTFIFKRIHKDIRRPQEIKRPKVLHATIMSSHV